MPKNFWLKDLRQRRHTRHLSLVNPYHFMSSWNINLTCDSEVKHLYIRSLNFQTIKILVFPALPTLQQGGGGRWKSNHSNLTWKPNHSKLTSKPRWKPNHSNLTWKPNHSKLTSKPMDAYQQVGTDSAQTPDEIPESQPSLLPPIWKKKVCGWLQLTLCECKQVE